MASLVSCKIIGGDTNDQGNSDGGNVSSEAFYAKDSIVGIIDADGMISGELLNDIQNVFYNLNVLPETVDPAKKTLEHELVIGECDREVSKKAYMFLSRMEAEEHHSSYVIYSDGKSIGVAFDHESALEAALNVLMEKYFTYESLTLQKGIYEQETISILDYYAEIDAAEKAAAFENLERQIGPEYGPAIVQALKEYYATLNPDVVKWFANLYDPDIGGYYFSNSGRNTPGYLPTLSPPLRHSASSRIWALRRQTFFLMK